MLKNTHFPLTLMVAAIISACSVAPTAPLTDAQNSFNNARSNPDVFNLSQIELKDASESLNKANNALNEGENDGTVNHYAYLASQQVNIAWETAKRKASETEVNNADAESHKVRLDARTAEADAANKQVAIAHEKANRQATELAIAGVNSERDQALIAEQEAQLKALNAKKTERGMMITLGDVLFSTNKAQLKSGGIRNLEKLAAFLSQYPEYRVSVEGHTDSRGSDEHNQELSERRSNTVQNALIDMAISSDRIDTRGFGEGFPVASNNNTGGQQLNRRVEIILSDAKGNITPR